MREVMAKKAIKNIEKNEILELNQLTDKVSGCFRFAVRIKPESPSGCAGICS
jgi:hypothetical protein